jgi:hypothetical protein
MIDAIGLFTMVDIRTTPSSSKSQQVKRKRPPGAAQSLLQSSPDPIRQRPNCDRNMIPVPLK